VLFLEGEDVVSEAAERLRDSAGREVLVEQQPQPSGSLSRHSMNG
jgi:hypothetical protein